MAKGTLSQRGCSPYTLMGCGCGLLGIIGVVLVFLLLMTLSMREKRDPTWSREDYAVCQRHLAATKMALQSYQQDHGKLPQRLEELRGHYLEHPSTIRCPLAIKELGEEYHYNPNAAHPTSALVVCSNHGQGRMVLQKNGLIKLPNYLWTRMGR